MSKNLLRFGFHDFLNAQPLLQPLVRLGREAGIEMVLDTPAAVAAKLKSGELDLAMIPSVEYLRHADRYRLLPGLAIASRGVVGTVLLVTRTPLKTIRTLSLDNRSLTSAALLKILFADRLSPTVRFHSRIPDLETMLATDDAALIIGDQAFRARERFPDATVYDLSEEWFRQTGKTFVHAVAAVRPDATLGKETIERIQQIEPRETIPEIVKTWAGKTGISTAECADYLSNRIIYRLGEAELEGLAHFRNLCHERGLIEQAHPIRSVDV
ncbi:MAG: menaquinone biosynthetic enzyme MqnA/MqnD family protein [Nitrospinales bacterium]